MKDITPQIAAVAAGYSYKKPPDLLIAMQDWVEKILRWISDFLSSLHIVMPGLTEGGAVANVMQVLLVGLAVVCAITIIYFAWTRLKDLSRQGALARKGQERSDVVFDAAGWRREAELLAGRKLWKEACRALYLSVLRLLDEKDVLEFVATRSNYEYFYALSGNPALARNFRSLSERVELLWFGNKIAGEDDYDHCRARADQMQSQVGAPGKDQGELAHVKQLGQGKGG